MATTATTPIRIPDALWTRLAPLIAARDPEPLRSGGGSQTVRLRPPRDLRRTLEGILQHEIAGCSWHRVPLELGDGLTISRTYKRWRASGLLAELYAVILRGSEGRHILPAGAPRLLAQEQLQGQLERSQTRERAQ